MKRLFIFILIAFACLQAKSIFAQSELWGVTSAGGTSGLGVIYKTNSDGSNYSVQHEFNTPHAGNAPRGRIIEVNGKLYGSTVSGGASNLGVIYECDPATNTYAAKVSFDHNTIGSQPQAGLYKATNGKLYGMSPYGGANGAGFGTLFEFDPATGIATTLVVFYGQNATGSQPNGIRPHGRVVQAPNGKLYGVTFTGGANLKGTLFEYDITTSTFTNKVDFDGLNKGALPYGGPIVGPDGKLYGLTTEGGIGNDGILYEYDPATNTLTQRFDFTSAIGIKSESELILHTNGKLYGVTQYGGANFRGSIFEFDPTTSACFNRYDFTDSPTGVGHSVKGSLSLASNGKIYGMTNQYPSLFEFDPVTFAVTKKTTLESEPYSSSVIEATNGKLYGATNGFSGAGGYVGGIIFEYDLATSSYTRKIELLKSPDGLAPSTELIHAADGKLYGATSSGGANGYGVIFEFDRSTHQYSTKFSFNDLTATGTGYAPTGNLVQAANGKLYGTARTGGPGYRGVFYEFDPATNIYTVRKSFNDSDGEGRYPSGELFLAVNGKIYGVSESVLFEFDPTTNQYTKKHTFTDYTASATTLIQAPNGKLYGVKQILSAAQSGYLFEFDIATSSFLKLYDFVSNFNTQGNITLGENGKIYGTTQPNGGPSPTLYEFDTNTNTYTMLYNFNYAVIYPKIRYIIDNNIYGVANNGYGVYKLFEYNIASNLLTFKQTFADATGQKTVGTPIFVRANQVITFDPLPAKTYADVSFLLTASADSGLPITYLSSNPVVATITGNTLNITGTGSVTITATQPGDANNYPATAVQQMLVVNKAPLTAKATDLSRLYGDANPTLSITYAGFRESETESVLDVVPSKSTTATSISDVGVYPIILSGGSDNNYDLALQNGTLTVNKAMLTATADAKTKVFGDLNPGLTISYTGFKGSDSPSVINTPPSAATNATTASNVGTYPIILTGGADDNYNLTLVDAELTINKATLTATADNKIKIYGDANPTFTISYAGLKGTDTPSVIDTSPEYSTTAITTSNVGTYPITLTGGMDDNYAFTLVGGTLTINKATLTATAEDKSKIYGDANPSFTFTYSGFLGTDDANVIDTPPSGSTTATINSGTGTYPITLTGGSDNNYTFAFETGTLTITKASLTAIAENKSKIYGNANPTLTIIYSGFKGADDISALDEEPTISTPALSTSDTGTYPISLASGSDNNYDFSLVDGVLTVTKAMLTATAEDKSKTYGDANPSLTITYSGFKGTDDVSVIDSEPSISTTATTASSTGAYPVSLTGGSDNNYDFTLVNGALTINKAILTATAEDKSKTYGDANPPLTIAYSGFKGTDDMSILDAEPGISTSATVEISAGTYSISLTGGSDNNYDFSLVNGTLTVNKAILTATAEDKSKIYGEANPPLIIAYSGFKGTDDASVLDNQPSVSTTALQTSDVGAYPISLTGGSDNNYDFTLIAGTLTINKATQTITFGPLPTKALGDPDFILTATGGGSGNPVTYTSSDPLVATIVGDVVTIVGAGSSTITASQAGNDNYYDATPVQQVQQVTLPKPTLPSSYIFLVNEFATQMDYYALPGDGMARLVVLKKDGPIDFVPADDVGYTVGQAVGASSDNFIGLILSGPIGYGTIKNLEPGASYYVKVFEFNQSNGFYSYLTTATATSGQVTMPQLTTQVIVPVNNAINAAVPTLTVTSSPVAGTTTYTIELYNNSLLTGTPLVKSGSSVSQSFTVAYSKQYFARVKTNLSADYGPITTFTTEPPEADAYVSAPANGSTGNLVAPTVTSNAVTGATTYYIELSTTSDFSSNVIVKTGAASQSFTGLQFSTTYYTRVKTNLSPNYGTTRNFTTGDALLLSVVASPASGSTGNATTLNISANNLTGATSYTIEISPDNTFSTGVISITSSSRTIAFVDIAYNTKYYTRVTTDLTPGQWGATRNFTTRDHAFQVIPANNSTNVNWYQTITANAISGGVTYWIEANTSPAFDGTSIVKTGSRTQTFVLQYNTQYYFRARCDLAASNSWGNSRTFTTGNPYSLAYVTSPANGGSSNYTSQTVATISLYGATSYTIELNTSSDFTGTSIVQTGATNSVTFAGLSPATTYYTRVKTNADPLWPDWGITVTNFTTVVTGGRVASNPIIMEPIVSEPLGVKIFGNPFRDRLTFIVNSLEQEELSVVLSDLSGKPVHESTEISNSFIEIEKEMAQGIYILRVQTEKELKAIRVMKID